MSQRGIAQRIAGLAVLALMVALLAPAAVQADSGSQPLQIEGYTVVGNLVQVTVSNPSPDTGTATVVVVAALTTGGVETGAQPITLAPGQTGTVTIGFSAPVLSVVDVGIGDEDNPF